MAIKLFHMERHSDTYPSAPVDKQSASFHFMCDAEADVADLPTTTAYVEGGKSYGKPLSPSFAVIIATGNLYILASNMTWTLLGG